MVVFQITAQFDHAGLEDPEEATPEEFLRRYPSVYPPPPAPRRPQQPPEGEEPSLVNLASHPLAHAHFRSLGLLATVEGAADAGSPQVASDIFAKTLLELKILGYAAQGDQLDTMEAKLNDAAPSPNFASLAKAAAGAQSINQRSSQSHTAEKPPPL